MICRLKQYEIVDERGTQRWEMRQFNVRIWWLIGAKRLFNLSLFYTYYYSMSVVCHCLRFVRVPFHGMYSRAIRCRSFVCQPKVRYQWPARLSSNTRYTAIDLYSHLCISASIIIWDMYTKTPTLTFTIITYGIFLKYIINTL